MTETDPTALDCGHQPTPSGCGTGVVVDSETEETRCYPCEDRRQRELIGSTPVFTGYVALNGRAVTTWSGGELVAIDSRDRAQSGTIAHTPTGGHWRRYDWHATDNQGGRWYGVNSGPGMVITMRRTTGAR